MTNDKAKHRAYMRTYMRMKYWKNKHAAENNPPKSIGWYDVFVGLSILLALSAIAAIFKVAFFCGCP